MFLSMIVLSFHVCLSFCFFFKDTATTDIYTYRHTLSLHDALPIWPHRVPLSRQVLAMLKELHEHTHWWKYLFPCVGHPRRRMSENTVNAGLRRLGYTSDQMTAHGFRAMAATLLNEMGEWHPDAIARQQIGRAPV